MRPIYSQGCRWSMCEPFTHKDGGGGGVNRLLTRMEVEQVVAIYSTWISVEEV